MAAAAPDSHPVAEMESLLTCSICLETLKEPRTLGCFHSFCKCCLQNYVKRQREMKEGKVLEAFDCPLCWTQFSLKQGEKVEGMLPNHFIDNMLEVLKIQHRAKELPCFFCGSQRPAVSRCTTCERYLCNNCLTTHNNWPDFNEHVVLTIDELAKPENQAKARGKPRCPKHEKKTLKFYCETCKELVCTHCIVLQHDKPNHSCLPIDEVAEKQRELLRASSAILDEQHKEGNEVLYKIEANTEALKNNAKKAKDDITQQKRAILKAFTQKLEEKAALMINEVDRKYNEVYEPLTQQKADVKAYVDKVKGSMDVAKNLLQKGSPEEVIHIQKLVDENVAKVKNERPWIMKPIHDGNIQFKAKSIVSMDDGNILNNLGEVVVCDPIIKPVFNTKFSQASVAATLRNTVIRNELQKKKWEEPHQNITPPKKESISRSRCIKPKSPGTVEVPDDAFIDVLVCNITGTFNIYLRLVGDEYSKKFESIQESMTCYYGASKDELTTEPAVGDLFALLSDEVWCRAKVVSISGETIHVLFVDHGDEVNTSKAELRVLATKFQQLPFQVFRCALNGLPKTKNPDVVDKLQKLVMGEVCIAEVFEKSADLVFVELIDTRSDTNIVVNDIIRTLVMPDEELKPVLPKVGKTIKVDVPYVSPSGSVFLHVLAAGAKRLDELNKDLTEHYIAKRSKANEFVSDPSVGKVCCAKCDEDGNWYRVKIISASNRNAVEVMYVDYGNTDTVPSTNLREPTQANEHVLSLPFQALECQLYDVPKSDWNEYLANRIMEIIAQGTVTAEVVSDGNPPSVSLLVTILGKDDEASTQRLTTLLGITFEDGLLIDDSFEGEVVEEVAEVPFPWKELPLDSGWMDVIVTNVKNLDNFTFQLLPNLEEFDKMAMEMNDYYQKSAAPTEATPVDGGVYAVFHVKEECWYRGMVESVVNNDKACVLFVDYGGEAVIGERNIRVLEKQFLELPFQGVQASLAGIKHTGKKWSRACIKDFKFNTLDRDLVAKVTNGDTSYCFSPKSRVLVELYDTSDPTQVILIAAGIIANHSDALSIT